jgi:hypothetical protein
MMRAMRDGRRLYAATMLGSHLNSRKVSLTFVAWIGLFKPLLSADDASPVASLI